MEGSSPTLARMGHSLVADVTTDSLIIYGGYSLYFTFLGDIWKYNTKTKNYVRETSWSTAPRPRYFHAADIYKVQLARAKCLRLCSFKVNSNVKLTDK